MAELKALTPTPAADAPVSGIPDWLRERKEFVVRMATLCDDAIDAARAARLRLRGEA
jgi:hypothetical protein